jgi:16S rRNA processing protein RimM
VSASGPLENRSAIPLTIGFIAGAHGVRGEVKVRLHHPDSEALFTAEHILAHLRSGEERELRPERVRPQGKFLIVGFEGVTDRSRAEALKGSTLIVSSDALPSLDNDEFYLESIRGFQVLAEDQRSLGVIADFLVTNMNILVVQSDTEEHLIPILEDTIRSTSDGIVTVRVAEGLLD